MKHINIFSKKRMRPARLLALLLCLAMALPLTGCGETKMEQRTVFAMDTVMTLTAYGKKAADGLAAAEGVILSLDAMLDPELATSTVYAINHAQGGNTVVSAQIAKMISTAQVVYNQSGGALDLSIYPLIKRWGFIDGKYYVPSYSEIAEDLGRLCFDQLVLTSFPATGGYSVSLPSTGEISFGAVAKGCASDSAIDAMRQAGVKSGIVSLGGNVQTLGLKPDGSQWNVAITDPDNPNSYVGVIQVGETAVVTSGSYQRYFTSLDGNTYHHILNPSSGYPTSNSLVSVTIICEDGTMADSLSTAMFVLGETRALNYWRTYGGFEMIMITKDNRIVCTKGLIDGLEPSTNKYTLSYSE